MVNAINVTEIVIPQTPERILLAIGVLFGVIFIGGIIYGLYKLLQ